MHLRDSKSRSSYNDQHLHQSARGGDERLPRDRYARDGDRYDDANSYNMLENVLGVDRTAAPSYGRMEISGGVEGKYTRRDMLDGGDMQYNNLQDSRSPLNDMRHVDAPYVNSNGNANYPFTIARETDAQLMYPEVGRKTYMPGEMDYPMGETYNTRHDIDLRRPNVNTRRNDVDSRRQDADYKVERRRDADDRRYQIEENRRHGNERRLDESRHRARREDNQPYNLDTIMHNLEVNQQEYAGVHTESLKNRVGHRSSRSSTSRQKEYLPDKLVDF